MFLYRIFADIHSDEFSPALGTEGKERNKTAPRFEEFIVEDGEVTQQNETISLLRNPLKPAHERMGNWIRNRLDCTPVLTLLANFMTLGKIT